VQELEAAIARMHDAVAALESEGGSVEELSAIGQQIMEIRKLNTRIGELTINGLREQEVSWRDIQARTTIPTTTARNWHRPPPES